MTELEQRIDQEVGRETEAERVSYLKFISLGRQLEAEARAGKDDVRSVAQMIMKEVLAIVKEANDAAMVVEKNDEDDAFAAMTEVTRESVQALLDTCDVKHTAIAKARDEKLAALYAKWS